MVYLSGVAERLRLLLNYVSLSKTTTMIIVHPINDFLFTLFPEVETGNIEKLKEALLKYYSYGPFVPKIEVTENVVHV